MIRLVAFCMHVTEAIYHIEPFLHLEVGYECPDGGNEGRRPSVVWFATCLQ
jgi:hypothetical protein